jgi:hypothetical protein
MDFFAASINNKTYSYPLRFVGCAIIRSFAKEVKSFLALSSYIFLSI